MLYPFDEFTFGTSGKYGAVGPTLQETRDYYSDVSWI